MLNKFINFIYTHTHIYILNLYKNFASPVFKLQFAYFKFWMQIIHDYYENRAILLNILF